MDFQVFTDGELEVIAGLRTLLPTLAPEFSGVYVGVKKPTTKDIAITVRSDGGQVQEQVLKDEFFGINIFVEGLKEAEGYAYASKLGAAVEACLKNLPKMSNSIKNVTLRSGAVRVVAPELEGEQRYITFSAYRRANTIKINEGN